ncbi:MULTISPECIES: CobW family GTP-binding protein [Hornefia]|uniref:CobW/HypB/UreG nucleotide-binding domain-containing protein n=1 Tax=Hornefia porci TaxID=2652292 RepID=A0A1Q9JJ05_9FIRM|nr:MULTISPECIES: GTP-binding protein [Hornefia]MDD6299798.1 GTP-binding protein [Hornefia butyriciproducens]OLR56144.1 hypothetical protein BHK98_08745 [Hornefia porci]
MIKLILLTGFLGAGKTTLLQGILDTYTDEKVGVVVNDFGKVNIDARLVERQGIRLSELQNGSVFCSCIKDKFVDTLIAMSRMNIDYLFVEASGLADPAGMIRILEGIKLKLFQPYDYRGAVCVIDGESFSELFEILPAINYQMEFCSAVIVNKADRIDEKTLSGILETVHSNNGDAVIYTTSYCRLDYRELVENLFLRNRPDRESTNNKERRPVTCVLKAEKSVEETSLRRLVEILSESCYRIKGFARTNRAQVKISAVGKNIEWTDWSASLLDATEIVVISAVGIGIISLIVHNIENCGLKGVLHL